MLKCNPKIVQNAVLFLRYITEMTTLSLNATKFIFSCFSISYLSYLHLRRQINAYGSYIVDVTVPTMIAVQKVRKDNYSEIFIF